MTIEEVKEKHATEGIGCSMTADSMIEWLIEEHDRLTAANKVLTEAVGWGVKAFQDYGKNGRAELLKQKANL